MLDITSVNAADGYPTRGDATRSFFSTPNSSGGCPLFLRLGYLARGNLPERHGALLSPEGLARKQSAPHRLERASCRRSALHTGDGAARRRSLAQLQRAIHKHRSRPKRSYAFGLSFSDVHLTWIYPHILPRRGIENASPYNPCGGAVRGGKCAHLRNRVMPAGACRYDRIARKRRETPLLEVGIGGMEIRFERPARERLRIIRVRNRIPIDRGGAANVRQRYIRRDRAADGYLRTIARH